MIDIDRLKALHEAATAAPWERDSEYDGDAIATSYEGCTSGYHNFFIGADVGGKWRTLLDTVNSDHKLIEDDRDENGGHSWDTIGEANTSLLVFLRNAVPSIIDMADRLTRYEAALREIAESETSMVTALTDIADNALGTLWGKPRNSLGDTQ